MSAVAPELPGGPLCAAVPGEPLCAAVAGGPLCAAVAVVELVHRSTFIVVRGNASGPGLMMSLPKVVLVITKGKWHQGPPSQL